MKFDDFISKSYEDLGIVQEEAQTSNVVKDFFKNVKAISKGGKPASAPAITLKDRSKVEDIKTNTIPKYEQAINYLNNKINDAIADARTKGEANPQNEEVYKKYMNIDPKEELPNRIAKNIYEIFNVQAKSGGENLTISLNELGKEEPKVKTGKDKGETKSVKDEGDVSFPQIRETSLKVLEPALKSGILKWEEARELSPQDLFNRLVNKSAEGVKKAGSWALNTDTGFAKM